MQIAPYMHWLACRHPRMLETARDMPEESPMSETVSPSGTLLQFLSWVALRPRRYGETMEAWRTSCPRLSVWEDAVTQDLVRLAGGADQGSVRVELTAAGEALIRRG